MADKTTPSFEDQAREKMRQLQPSGTALEKYLSAWSPPLKDGTPRRTIGISDLLPDPPERTDQEKEHDEWWRKAKSEWFRVLMDKQDQYLKAFIQETGAKPSQVELQSWTTHDGDFLIQHTRYVKRTTDG